MVSFVKRISEHFSFSFLFLSTTPTNSTKYSGISPPSSMSLIILLIASTFPSSFFLIKSVGFHSIVIIFSSSFTSLSSINWALGFKLCINSLKKSLIVSFLDMGCILFSTILSPNLKTLSRLIFSTSAKKFKYNSCVIKSLSELSIIEIKFLSASREKLTFFNRTG